MRRSFTLLLLLSFVAPLSSVQADPVRRTLQDLQDKLAVPPPADPNAPAIFCSEVPSEPMGDCFIRNMRIENISVQNGAGMAATDEKAILSSFKIEGSGYSITLNYDVSQPGYEKALPLIQSCERVANTAFQTGANFWIEVRYPKDATGAAAFARYGPSWIITNNPTFLKCMISKPL